MNIYNDDAIFLSAETAKAFVSSLRNDKESIFLRDEFISDIEQNIMFSDDGSITLDVPEIDLVGSENYMPIKVAVNTKEINISVNVSMTVRAYYSNLAMQNYNRVNSTVYSKYNVAKKIQNTQCTTTTEILYNVA